MAINIISLIVFFIFLSAYLLKLVLMNKRAGIKALVLAKGNKGRAVDSSEFWVKTSTFLWGAVWILESLFSEWFAEYVPYLFQNKTVSYTGLLVITMGLVFFILSMITMKNSWRVGIDQHTKTQLITDGLYKYSRNPAFVGFNLMFIGLLFTYPNLVTLIVCLMNLISIHRLILQEEKHLENMFQRQYTEYKNKTPRYFLVF
ncbi:methyltransferase family protein [Paenibacillus sp. S-38]|uniref:methyltransferase family protein n=1 Tax=Paenibacillus sp. S-38 TaxID=3416710 RepID=UPI003CEB266B